MGKEQNLGMNPKKSDFGELRLSKRSPTSSELGTGPSTTDREMMDLMRVWVVAGINLPDGEPGSPEEAAFRAEHVAKFRELLEKFPVRE